MTVIEEKISQSILDQIDSADSWKITALNNNVTPFNLVFYVLHTVVPLTDDEAYSKTMQIHLFGEALIYKGTKDHCEKIGDALSKIKVESKIEND
jgi:ATP-dependent Clp protease adapter protein ClpS